MKKSRSLAKSPLAFAREALAAAKEELADYSNSKSPHLFTQPQLFAMLALKDFLKTDFRGIVALIAEWSDLREALGIKRLPHYSTPCVARKRLLKKGASSAS
jgi:hypothetical protein